VEKSQLDEVALMCYDLMKDVHLGDEDENNACVKNISSIVETPSNRMVQQKKNVIMNTVMLNYLSVKDLDPYLQDWKDLWTHMDNTCSENFETIPIVTLNETGGQRIFEYLRGLANQIDSLEPQDDWEEIRNKVSTLYRSVGFRFGVKGFNSIYKWHDLLDRIGDENTEVYLKKHYNGLRRYLFDLSDTQASLYSSHTEMRPFYARNALTFYTDELLLDLDPVLFIILPSNRIAFDISELVALIASSKGANEHMGLPSLPEKGTIWGHEDLYWILDKIFYICELADDETVLNSHPYMEKHKDYYTKLLKSTHLDMCNTIKAVAGEQFNLLLDFENVGILNDVKAKFKSFEKMVHDIDAIKELLDKIPDNKVKAYYPFLATIHMIIENNLAKYNAYKVILKDINLLHLLGLLGLMMIGDNVTSMSTDPDTFKITNHCKSLFERYFFDQPSPIDDDDYEANALHHYYVADIHESVNGFDKQEILNAVKGLQLNGRSVATLMNEPICNHGIGRKLIRVYLETMHGIRKALEDKYINEHDIPFYAENLLSPLPCFKELDNGVCIYLVKELTDKCIPCVLNNENDKNITFDGLQKNGKVTYNISLCDLNTGYDEWQGFITINNDFKGEQASEENFCYRTYTKHSFKPTHNPIYDDMIESRMGVGHNAIKAGIMYATDIFSQHRLEHFTIFARYVMDFSNMLYKSFKEGVLQEVPGKGIQWNPDKLGEFFKYEAYKDYQSVNKEDIGSVIEYLYSTYLYSDNEELIGDLKSKFEQQIDLNSQVVAKSFEKGVEDHQLKAISKMVYFCDTLGKMSDIYKTDVRKGTKKLFGIMEPDIADALGNLGENGDGRSFNEIVIKKSMLSKVLLKFLNRNVVNPYFFQISDNFASNKDVNNLIDVCQRSTVRASANYLNIDKIEVNENPMFGDDLGVLVYKYFLACIFHGFIHYLFKFSIMPMNIKQMPFMSHLVDARSKGILGKFTTSLMDTSGFAEIYRFAMENDTSISNDLIKTMCKNGINKLKTAIYQMLFKILSINFAAFEPASFSHNFATLSMYEEILKELGEGMGPIEQGMFQNMKNLVDDENTENPLKIYYDGGLQAFPVFGDMLAEVDIFNKNEFCEEMFHLACKNKVVDVVKINIKMLVELFNTLNTLEVVSTKPRDKARDDDTTKMSGYALLREHVNMDIYRDMQPHLTDLLQHKSLDTTLNNPEFKDAVACFAGFFQDLKNEDAIRVLLANMIKLYYEAIQRDNIEHEQLSMGCVHLALYNYLMFA
jgi:hypothetical protein